MNLKIESTTKVHPNYVWIAEALKPERILISLRSMILEVSKNLGAFPTCFKFVSLNAYFIIMLIKF